MKFEEALEEAKLGSLLMLPNYEGYFKWDWSKQELYFYNGSYYKYITEMQDQYLENRNDWYYII